MGGNEKSEGEERKWQARTAEIGRVCVFGHGEPARRGENFTIRAREKGERESGKGGSDEATEAREAKSQWGKCGWVPVVLVRVSVSARCQCQCQNECKRAHCATSPVNK